MSVWLNYCTLFLIYIVIGELVMSDVFKIHGWRKDKAVFEVELLLKSWIECEDVQGISSIFNTQPYNDFSSGC